MNQLLELEQLQRHRLNPLLQLKNLLLQIVQLLNLLRHHLQDLLQLLRDDVQELLQRSLAILLRLLRGACGYHPGYAPNDPYDPGVT